MVGAGIREVSDMSEQIEGRNAVLGLSGSEMCGAATVYPGRMPYGPVRTIAREARKKDTIINYVAKERLDQLSETGAHQGVIAQVAAYEYAMWMIFLQRHRKREKIRLSLFWITLKTLTIWVASCSAPEIRVSAHGVIIPKRSVRLA